MSLYLVVEGPDGCGKSTQAAMLTRWLKEQGRDTVHLREPGSTPVGESLRALLLAPQTGDLSPVAEALLFSAARTEMIRTSVAPALRAGTIVVAERCYLSTWVYQGFAADAGVPLDVLRELTRHVQGDVWPDRIFVLDVPYDTGSSRVGRPDRIESRSREYHERVRAGYAEIAESDERCTLVDGTQSVDVVHEALCASVQELLAGEVA